jgi:hypothetical protein
MFFKARQITVRHWRYGYQHDHVGRDTSAALHAALECVSRNVSAWRFDAMVNDLNKKGQAQYEEPGHSVETYRIVR